MSATTVMTTAEQHEGNKPLLINVAHAIIHAPSAVWLTISGLGMTLIYWLAFAQRYSIDKFGNRIQQSIATLNGFSPDGAFLYIFSFVALFALYVFAIRFGLRGTNKRLKQMNWIIVGVFAVVLNAALLPMYNFDAVDIYDYILRGRMSAVYGLNPLAVSPDMHDMPAQTGGTIIKVPSDPFYNFAAWHNVPSAYGPAWEMVANIGSRIAGDDYQRNIYVFKLISVLGYLLTALFIVLTLLIVAPKRALLGFLLFAWNPLVVYMTGGGGHNDTLMTVGLVVGVYCLVKRWYVAGILAALLGALIKFMPVLLIPIIAIVALRELSPRLRIRFLVLSAVLGGLLLLLVYGPYWNGIDTLGIGRRSAMYTGSVATLVRQTLGIPLDGHSGETSDTPNANNVIKYAVIALFAMFYLSVLWDVWENHDQMQPIRAITAVLLFYLLIACLWFQSWYVIWVVALVAMLDNSPMRRLVLWFSYFVTWESFLYNYVTLRPPRSNWADLPWRDLIPVAVIMGPPLAYILWFWISTWLRSGTRTPYSIALGKRLSSARQAAQLSITDLADDLDLHTDDLQSYERGDKIIPLSSAVDLAEHLNLNIADLTAKP